LRNIEKIRTSQEYTFFLAHRDAISYLSYESPPTPAAAPADKQKTDKAVQSFVQDANQYPALIQTARIMAKVPVGPAGFTPRSLATAATALLKDRIGDLFLLDRQGALIGLLTALAVLLAIYHLFQIQNVFHTPQLIVIYPHPHFTFLFLQLTTVILAPVFLYSLIEAGYWSALTDLINPVVDEMGRPFSLTRPEGTLPALGSYLALAGPSPSLWHLAAPAVLLSVASAMAALIWLSRRFGWGVVLTSTVVCAVAFLVLLIVTSPLVSPAFDFPLGVGFHYAKQGVPHDDVNTLFLAATALFLFMFLLGRFLSLPLRRYLISAGYSGFLFAMTILIGYFLSVSTVSWPLENGLSGIGIAAMLTAITVAVVVLFEMLLRRVLRRYLEEPQS
jgi:hypothetical protein